MLGELGSSVAIIGIIVGAIVGSQLIVVRWLDGKIDKVREASEVAHSRINNKLDALNEKSSGIDKQVGILTERVNCVIDKVEKIENRLSGSSG